MAATFGPPKTPHNWCIRVRKDGKSIGFITSNQGINTLKIYRALMPEERAKVLAAGLLKLNPEYQFSPEEAK